MKGWPWWKLFTTVRPLIEVQLTEEQIRGKDVSNLSSSLTTSNAVNRHVMYRFSLLTIVQLNSKPISVAFNAPLGFSTPWGSLSNSAAALSRTQIACLFDYCLCGFASIQVFVESCVCLCVRRVTELCVCIHYLCSWLDQKQLCFPRGSALACHRVCARACAFRPLGRIPLSAV